jgi:predicted secreted protein
MTASAILLGNEYMLWVEATTPGTYNAVKGQGTLTINRSQQKIDTSSKDTSGYATSAYGLKDLTIDVDVKVSLPDASGYTRLETLCNAEPPAPFNVQVRKGGASGEDTDAIFEASVYGSISSIAFNQNGTVDAKVQLALAAAPATDALA